MALLIGSILTRWFTKVVTNLDQSVGWHRVPLLVALVMLIGMRTLLRQKNLSDVSAGAPPDPTEPSSGEPRTRYLVARTADGTFNDLDHPAMGSANTRFGRNVPLKDGFPDEAAVLSPNPRVVSTELLTREAFIPATILNLLAAAWVQFMIHDWFSHGKNQKENPWEVPLQDDDPWPEHPMRILRTSPDPTYSPDIKGLPPTHLNTATHW